MADYHIKTLDLRVKEVSATVTALENETFEAVLPKKLQDDDLLKNTATANKQSVFFGAYKNNELAAVLGFLAHSLQLNNTTEIAYQACWRATSSSHRKQGLFSKLMNHAKTELKERNGAFIFGFPNHNSHPIMIKHLGFREIPLRRITLPTVIFSRYFINRSIQNFSKVHILETRDVVLPIQAEIFKLKKDENNGAVKIYDAYNNIIWGKTRSKVKKGIKIEYFEIGGIVVNKPHLLAHVFNKLVDDNPTCKYVDMLFANESNTLTCFRGSKEAPQSEPLLVYDLTLDTSPLKLNFMTGMKDVF